MTRKKTPSNKRIQQIDSQKIRMLLITQTLQVKALKRENARLKKRVKALESSHRRTNRFLNKLSYAFEVILNLVRNPFWRNKK